MLFQVIFRRVHLLACLLVLTSVSISHSLAESRENPGKPNIVFIISDDQRWDYLGLAGHPVLETPNIDRIGEEGVWMTNCFSTTPLCSPSRASFLARNHFDRVLSGKSGAKGTILAVCPVRKVEIHPLHG